MMERLKKRDSDDQGELVTRSDGTQAMRRRKRRRRTEQPEKGETKRNTRMQIAQIAGVVILLAAVGLVAGISLLYANSASFRDSLISKLESASGAKVTLTQFRMNPATANANSAYLVWPSGNILGTLELGGIVAKHSPESFLGRVFTGEEIVASRGTLDLKAADTGGEIRQVPKQEGDSPVRFTRYSIPSLNVRFGADRGYWGGLLNTEASMFPGVSPGITEIRLKDGALRLRDWPEMTLDRGYMKVRNAELQVQTLRFLTPSEDTKRRNDRGAINFSGSISPMDSGQPCTLVAELQSFPIQYLLGRDLGRFFHGNIDTQDIPDSNFLTFSPDLPEEARLEVTVTNSVDSRLDLSGFKVFALLAATLEDGWYELPEFDDEISLKIKRQGASVEVSEINAVKRGRIIIRGALQNAGGGQLRGTLRIGLPDTTVVASRNTRLDRMFSEVRENYRWIEIKISGTSAVPQDNFLELFDLASKDNVVVPDREEASPEPDTFDSLIEGER
ncbi:MAG: hypothetical protein NWR03_01945 [Akkermansiaceae bacterium]|nr:hypothetical protein [Akkermansiaceae bacterium]MDP4896521.1 hypothetical protein [Akkermansiaceae bacterium]